MLTACRTSPAVDGGVDGGPDAGHDASASDGGRDAAIDGGSDGGAMDSGSGNPGWIFVQGLPEGCRFEVARDPSAALPPLRFEPCRGRSGCRRAVVDWPWSPGSEARLGRHESSTSDGAHAYFTWVRSVQSTGRWWWYYTIARDDGQPRFVLRKPTEPEVEGTCTIRQLAITPRSFATAVTTFGGDYENQSFPLRGRFDDPEGWATVTARPSIDDLIQDVYTSDTTTALDSAGRTYRYGPDGAIEQLSVGPTSTIDAVDGDLILASVFANPEGWRGVVFQPGETTAGTIVPASAEGEAGMLRPDGDELSFFRLIEPITVTRYTRAELWVSATDGDRQPLAPRFLSRLPVPGVQRSVAHRFGRVQVGQALDVIGIYDTTTGERREYRSPPERATGGHSILAAEEIGVGVAFLQVSRGLETIEFVRYDSLPVVPVPE